MPNSILPFRAVGLSSVLVCIFYYNAFFEMVPPPGIELGTRGYKALVIPLNYGGVILVVTLRRLKLNVAHITISMMDMCTVQDSYVSILLIGGIFW